MDTRKTGFFKEDRGATLVSCAILLVALLSSAGLVIDLGALIVVKAELQNAADAGALAGASALFNPTYSSNSIPRLHALPPDPHPINRVLAAFARGPFHFAPVPAVAREGMLPLTWAQVAEPRPPVTYCDMARAAARATVTANKAGGRYLAIPNEDISLGTYGKNAESGKVEFTPGGCSNSTNAIRVITRKNLAMNGPVYHVFAGILGKKFTEVSAESIAMMGWVKGIGKGRGTFPLAMGDKYVPQPGEKMLVTFSPNLSDTGGWHTFSDPSASANDLKKLINGTTPSPEIQCGDMINMTNGVDTAVVQEMLHQFKDVHHGHWTIIMPVVSGNLSYLQERNVLGFCAFEVLEVKGPPDKTVTGYAVGGYILPGTEPGGPEMGLRAGAPRMAW